VSARIKAGKERVHALTALEVQKMSKKNVKKELVAKKRC
jgi:hypothetical protein